jgi:CheY-like chemotaxis protein
MNNEQIGLQFQMLRQQITALGRDNLVTWQDIDAVLEDLQVSYEELQTSLESAEITKEVLFQQNQRITADCCHYRELFQFSPVAYLITDAHGIIQEANQAIAQLLNTSQEYIDGYSLIRQIRALEAQRGGYLPAAAITAYLDENPEKSLKAGFEAHLYKLVQPNEWVELVAKLAERASTSERI